MKTTQILAELLQQGVQLWVEEGQLRFRAPRGVVTSAHREALRTHKSEILGLLQEGNRYVVTSFAQRRLWFIQQLMPDSPAYNISAAYQWQGPLDARALAAGLAELVQRHESLRTTFTLLGGQPVQVITAKPDFELDVIDLSDTNLSTTEVIERATAVSKRPFSLTDGPLIRATLWQLNPAHHVFLLTIHHIVTDGWSMGILHRELSQLYAAHLEQQPAPLPPLSRHYADFATWQQRWLQGDVLQEQLAYWQQQLQDAPPLLDLPADYPRPTLQSFAGKQHAFSLDTAVLEKLQALGRQEGATLFMVLLTAFQILLWRYSGQEDLVIGTPIANRNRTEIEGIVGFFVNTLLIRARINANRSFVDLLTQTRAATLAAYAHQDLPFEKLVETLQPERNLSHNPLFQVMFALQNAPAAQPDLPEISSVPLSLTAATAHFDLTLSIENVSDTPGGILEYNTDLFGDDRMLRLVAHYRKLLAEIAADPHRPVSRLPLLSTAVTTRLLETWSQATADYPRTHTIHELLARQSRQTPNATALVFRDQQFSYAELQQQAHQLAHYLRRQGVGAETRVGLCLRRSPEMIITILAILEAGGVYVPLDSNYPAERLAFMIADTGLSYLVTETDLSPHLPAADVRIICLDREFAHAARQPSTPLPNVVTPANLAYIMYTSGSTGQPKGIGITHQNVLRLVKNTNYASLGPEETFLQMAPISFDASTFELWGSLLNGGKLVIYPSDKVLLSELEEVLQKHKVTTLWLTAGLFQQMAARPAALAGIRQLLAGGDVLPVAHVQHVLNQLPHLTLINGYGPTECTTFTCCHPMRDAAEIEHTVPIGRPITNTELFILDPFLQPVPVGVPGELYVGGDGLARGYWRRPGQTAVSFIPHPFSRQPGARLYKTGDVVRYRSDGTIEFLGRRDNQVKVRGFRIELGEIEVTLARHPQIQSAVVVLHGQKSDDKRLVAYLVPQPGQNLTVDTLRHDLQQHLPEHMIPGTFITLDELPLTANGKVDRKALPRPGTLRPELASTYVPPRTPAEEILCGIWSQILQISPVGIYDNFFALGGHSLLLTQIASRIHDLWQKDVPLRRLFQAPTVAQMAAHLAGEARQAATAEKIRPVSRAHPLPLSYAQQRIWFLRHLHPQSCAYHMPFAYHLRGEVDVAALEQSLQALVDRHEGLRTGFLTLQDEPMQQVTPTVPLSLPVVDLQDMPPREQETAVSRIAAELFTTPFDLSSPPLLRLQLIRTSAHEHLLLLVLHHIISDGWSMSIFFAELPKLYAAFAAKKSPDLPPLPVQYADFAVWQREWLQGDVLQTQLAYWQQQLTPPPAPLRLPARHAPLPAQAQDMEITRTLPPELTQAVQNRSREAGVTTFMWLTAVFKLLLYRLTGQHDVSLGTPIANRNRTEVENLIGCFVNTLVLRTDLSGNPPFTRLLAQVRETMLDAYAHQDLPFEKLVEELDLERNLERNPLFNVMINFVNTPDSDLALPGLSVTRTNLAAAEAKFDLNLYLVAAKTGFELNLVYAARYETAFVERLLAQYAQLLQQIAANPEQPILTYSLRLPEDESILPDPTIKIPEPAYPLLTEQFSRCVRQHGARPAVQQNGRSWTYRELDTQARALAQQLQQQGVQPGDVIAVAGRRSVSLIAAMLAAFYSGGVLLTLAPDLPPQRQRLMLQTAGARFMLAVGDPPVTLPDTIAVAPMPPTKDNSLPAFSPPALPGDAPAYLFFTSGSTGTPKGVLGCHKGLAHFLTWQREKFAVSPRDRSAQLTALSFDVVLRDIFLPLTGGATLCLPPPDAGLGADEVLPWLQQEQITLLHTVPALADLWLQDVPTGVLLPSLRCVFFAGEPLSHLLVQRWRAAFPGGTQIANLYGPTETTLAKCCYVVPDPPQPGVQPVGNPLPQTQALVLNEAGLLCTPGEPGEIVLRTPFRSLGYLHDAASTSKRFLPNPFTGAADDLVYFTGDGGRYRTDGVLEILGRLDHQIKIRGVRIEPDEIAAVLNNHPAVKSALVLYLPAGQGEKRLVAYLIASPLPARKELHAWLEQSLPPVMVPNVFVFVETWPLLPNGKVNRRALPPPAAGDVTPAANRVQPRNPTERRLADLWCALLALPGVGVYDNFFTLGGHSLLATQLVSRIRQQFAVDLPLREFFAHPTIAELAAVLQEKEQAQENQPPPSETGSIRRMARTARRATLTEDGRIITSSIPPQKSNSENE